MCARLTPLVGPHISRKDIEGAAYETDGAVRVSTCTASVDLAEATRESYDEAGVGLPPGEKGNVISDGREPQDARATLPGALPRQITSDAGSFRHAAGPLAEDGEHAHPGGRADRA